MAEMGPTTRPNAERLAGNLLRLARIERSWTQAQLAAAAGITQPVIARIECGKVQPTLRTLCRLLAAADLDLRCRLEPYEDHDDVLDARAAQFPRSTGAPIRPATPSSPQRTTRPNGKPDPADSGAA